MPLSRGRSTVDVALEVWRCAPIPDEMPPAEAERAAMELVVGAVVSDVADAMRDWARALGDPNCPGAITSYRLADHIEREFGGIESA